MAATGAAKAAAVRKIAIDFPASLFEETEAAVIELATNRSALVREAVSYYLHDIRRKKLEEELTEGYIANAAQAQNAAEDMMGAEGDLA